MGLLRSFFLIAAVGTAFAAPAWVNTNSTLSKRDPGFAYGTDKVRGVNLGGWLVLEPWITPSIFDNTGNSAIVDEWTFGQYMDYDTGANILWNHWGSWVQESDFEAIAAAGLNHVRIPIGFWAFDTSGGEPYFHLNQYDYLKTAVGWAGNYGIKVLVDLHGVPGSQNGYDNSGERGNPNWQNNADYVTRTQAIIATMSSDFSQSQYQGVVTAIELVNEPAGYYSQELLDTTRNYYTDTYPTVRNDGSLVVVLHDAFQSFSYWSGFLTEANGGSWVMMDTHIYQVFEDYYLEMSWDDHISNACSNAGNLASNDLWTIVGEWSTASTDCATYINGRGMGSRYDGSYGDGAAAIGNCYGQSGSSSTFSSEYKTFLRQFWEAQVSTYEQGDGWIYWCWKNEDADDWSYSAGLAGGWISSDPDDREYPNICG
ncbi:glycoside hydrolase [Dacryopinax primogenitus]|uniref:glucan 1,3-beta-glucosidase n=1 Tax=Dacryopinax primogenitus (strain DJM 731) TaxID=1858805 RepID=M5G451_DACPD|nr:glycoside hydrolase [Dacryopinax primogenitus]EJU03454.1 glycoside hydrolase [Dacryopinax primogenitus]